jgi:predicted lipoprotein with Yx(FWY)xxD motif
MPTNPGRRLATAAVALLALGGLLAACGDDNGKGSAGGGGSGSKQTTTTEGSTTTASSAPAAADLSVSVKKDATLGTILADPEGRTLYTLTDGSGAAVDCTGPCLPVWPPLELAAGATAPTAPDGVDLSVVDAPDGAKLIAADGLPLYTFAGDGSPADAKGEGLVSFGGTWHVVKTTAAVTSPASSGGSSDETSTTGVY